MRKFHQFGGTAESLPWRRRAGGLTKTGLAYHALEKWLREATDSGQFTRAYEIREAVESIRTTTHGIVAELTTKYGPLGALSTPVLRAMQLPPPRHGPATSAALPVIIGPPVGVPTLTAPPVAQLGFPGTALPIVQAINPAFPEPPGGLVQTTGAPGPPRRPASPGLPASKPPARKPATSGAGGSTRPPPSPALRARNRLPWRPPSRPLSPGTSSSWLQPADPVPMPGTVPFDFGVHHAGETVQPPLFTAAPGSTAPAPSPGAPFLTSSWLEDDFAVERDILAARFPPLFDASQLVIDASMHAELGLVELGLVEELAAGRIPFQAIDALIATYRTTDDGGSNTPYIEYLLTPEGEHLARSARRVSGAGRPAVAHPGTGMAGPER